MPSNESPPLPEDIKGFQKQLISWFQREGKSYPWRETTDPYAILVSELMLQQTRIATVLERNYFSNWMERFPTVDDLAKAAESDVLKAWEGLGYYNRARNLQKAAQKIVATHGGVFPDSPDQIEALPGVGRYTAGAVASFAFGKFAPIVDGNVVRVYARLFAISDPVDLTSTKNTLWDIALALTPRKKTREFNSAVMELGQRICTRSSPSCLLCPVKGFCRSLLTGEQNELPAKSKKQSITDRREHAVLVEKGGRIFLVRETGTRRKGLWRLPLIDPESTPSLPKIYETRYAITRYRVTLTVYQFPESEREVHFQSLEEGDWFSGASAADLPAIAAPYRKVLEELGKIPLRDQVPRKTEPD